MAACPPVAAGFLATFFLGGGPASALYDGGQNVALATALETSEIPVFLQNARTRGG